MKPTGVFVYRPLIAALFIALACAFASGGVSRAQPAAPPPPPASLGSYYIALGDSLAYGVTDPSITPDPTCKSTNAPGYVCLVYAYLKQLNPNLQLLNLSAPDVDSCVLLNGFGSGSPCTNKPGPATLSSPVQAAVDFIKAHPGQVGLVTLNAGGADLIPLLPHALEDPAGTAAKLPGIFKAFQGNLDASLKALHAALGSAGRIVVATQYNPLGGIASPPLPAGLPAIASGAIGSMNNLIKSVSAADGAQVADVAAAFDANPGGAALLTFVPTTLAGAVPDIYPLPEGYRLYARIVLKATGFIAPLKLTAKLKHKSVKRGGTDAVAGKTTTDASITVKLKLPGKSTDSTTIVADNAGAYSWSFAPEGKAGKGTLRVCSTDPVSDKSLCSKKLAFTVR